MKRFILMIGLLATGFAWAEPLKPIGFELYSWQVGSNWHFAVFEGTATARSIEMIKAPKHRLKGLTYVKGRLAALPENEIIHWREDKARGLRLPPQEIVHELNQYARTAHLKLLLPGQAPVNKANEEIHQDLRRIIE